MLMIVAGFMIKKAINKQNKKYTHQSKTNTFSSVRSEHKKKILLKSYCTSRRSFTWHNPGHHFFLFYVFRGKKDTFLILKSLPDRNSELKPCIILYTFIQFINFSTREQNLKKKVCGIVLLASIQRVYINANSYTNININVVTL